MQPQFTEELITPIGKHKVMFKTMITGAEREQIDAASMKFIDTKDGKEFTVKDMAGVTTAEKHALIKVCVLSIDDDPTDCFDRWQKMFEPDYIAVYDAILGAQKKTVALT